MSKYYIPLEWKEFNADTLEDGEYYVGIRVNKYDNVTFHEVLDLPYEWVSKKWLLNGFEYNLQNVVCVAKKYPFEFPKEFRL